MALKTLKALNIPAEALPSIHAIEGVAKKYEARECQHQEEKHWGFCRFDHKSDSHEAFVTPLHNGRWAHFQIALNKRILPPDVVKQAVKKRAAELQKRTGEELSKKELRDLKDEVRIELLGKAFSKETIYNAILDYQANQLWLESTSGALTDNLLKLLRRSLGSLPVTPAIPEPPLPNLFAAWFSGNMPLPGDIRIGNSAKAIDPDEPKASVTLSHEELADEDIQKLLNTRMLVKLGLENDYVQSTIDDTGTLKSIKLSINTEDSDADPDHMTTLWCMEMSKFLSDLLSGMATEADADAEADAHQDRLERTS